MAFVPENKDSVLVRREFIEHSAQLIPQNPMRETGKPQRLQLPYLGNEKQFLIIKQ